MDKRSSQSHRPDKTKQIKNVEGSKTDIGPTPSGVKAAGGVEDGTFDPPDDEELPLDPATDDPVVDEYDDDDKLDEGDEEQQPLNTQDQSRLILHMMMNPKKDYYSYMKMSKLMRMSESEMNLFETPSMREFLGAEDKKATYEAIYGKIRSKKSAEAIESGESGGPPTPKNLYEALQSELARANTKALIYRLVMTGTHKETQDNLIEFIRNLIEGINQHCNTEVLTGVLILFPNHFIHVIEGSEDTLYKFIRCAADQFEPTGSDWNIDYDEETGSIQVRESAVLTSVKTYVVGVFKLKHRGIASGWKTERVVQTPISDKDIPKGGFRQKLYQFTKKCCITALAVNKLAPIRQNTARDSVTLTPKEIADAKKKYEDAKSRRSQAMAKILPKTPYIDYILRKSPKRKLKLRTLREHLEFYWKIPHVVLPHQTDFPIPGNIGPYD